MQPRLRPMDLWSLLFLALVCVGIVLAVAFDGAAASEQPTGVELNVASLMVDDGFYCLMIAENLSHGLSSTFDGLHETNGYHPLWLLARVPVPWLADDRGEALLLAFALQALLMSGTALLPYRIVGTSGHQQASEMNDRQAVLRQ